MKRDIFGLLISGIFIAVVLVSSRLIGESNKEASRKYIHIMLSNWWIIAMLFFDSVYFAIIGPLLFIIINSISYKYNLIKTMERDESEKDGFGTVYYAITLFLIAILTFGVFPEYKGIYGPLIGLAGVAVMGYSDGFAAIVGKSIKSPSYRIGTTKKTLAGSITMLAITFIILSGFLVYVKVPYWYFKAAFISVIVTVIEAVSIKGTDNLTVPLATVGLLLLLI